MNEVFSTRSEGIQESATLRLTAKVRELKKAGKDVISYGAGEPHFDPPAFLYNAVRKALSNDYAKYTPVLGLPEVRDVISSWVNRVYKLNTQASWIALTNGAKGALHAVFQVLLNPGDEVVFQSPYWVSYPPMVRISGGVSRVIPTYAGQRFRITPEQLKKSLTPKTKIFLFNSPQNPTGIAYSQEEINALAEVLKAYPNVWVLSDDIYDHILWDLSKRAHFAFSPKFDMGRLIHVQGLSKSHAVTGWREGYVCAPPHVIQKINVVMGHALGHISAIHQYVMQVAYSESFDFLKSWVAYYQNNMQRALPILQKIGAKTVVPEGAFYLFPEVTHLYKPLSKKFGIPINDDFILCETLLDRLQVGWVPGVEFGLPGYVRLTTAMTAERFQEGLLRVQHVLATAP